MQYPSKITVTKVVPRINREIEGEPEYMMTWQLNTLCNFMCEYCFWDNDIRAREHPNTGKYTPQHIAKCFDRTGKIWRIHLSGGEPLLYPRFVELVEALTCNHYVSINTNLSRPNAYVFADMIKPERVLRINAALHIMELEKRKHGIKGYIERFLYLQDRGFPIRLEYVAYPPLLGRLAKDLRYFKLQDIKDCNIKIFLGRYNSHLYPGAYTNKEKRLIIDSDSSISEKRIAQESFNFFGRLCSAGHNYLHMNVSGELTRCGYLRKKYGNLFTGDYKLDEFPKPCPLRQCRCPYEGMRCVQTQYSSVFSIAKEIVLEGVHFKKEILELVCRKMLLRPNP